MTWLWILLAIFALFVVVPLVVGMLLSDLCEGTVVVELDPPPERVWPVLCDHERHPVTGARMRSIHPLPSENGLERWIEELGSTRIVVSTEVSEPPQKLVRRMEDQVAPMTARWTLELAPTEEGGTELRAHNRTVIRSGSWRSPVFRIMMRSSGGAEKVLREYIRGIAGELGVTARLVKGA